MDLAERRKIVAEYCRSRLRQEIGEKRGRAAEISRATGITTAHISNMTSPNPTRGVGPETVEKLAELWGFKSLHDLETVALREHEKRPIVEAVPAADRYPSRAATVDWARRVGYSERAIGDLQTWALKSEKDPGGKYWADLLDVLERQGGQPLGAPMPAEKPAEPFHEKLEKLSKATTPRKAKKRPPAAGR